MKISGNILVLTVLALLVGCLTQPSDEQIEKEIKEYAKKCSWRIEVPNKSIYETYSGSKVDIIRVLNLQMVL